MPIEIYSQKNYAFRLRQGYGVTWAGPLRRSDRDFDLQSEE
jgi:hypothetical protein